jgi:pimeloyl-ACP methyl ester carboxylesterase
VNFRLRGTGPHVLLLHGIPTSGRLWDMVVEILEQKFTCVTVDLPGFGDSAPLDSRPDLWRFAVEIEQLREQLSVPRWHVVGHDAGSAVAVQYSATFPDSTRKVALCSPPIFPELRLPWAYRILRTPLLGDLLAPLIIPLIWHIGLPASLERRDKQTSLIIAAFRRPFRGIAGARRLVRVLRWGDPIEVLSRTATLLPMITAPTLILHGSRDETIPVDFTTRAASLIPDASVQILDSGHFLPLNCPKLLCSHLLRFMNET